MKNIIRILAIIAVSSFVFACSKENQTVTEPENGTTALNNPVELSFTATLDNAVKSTVDASGKCSWEEGDQIKICWLDGSSMNSAVATAQSAGATTTFTATVEDAAEYYAVYPSSVSASLDASGKLTLTNPVSQDGSYAKAAISAAFTTRESLSFAFKQAVSLLKFEIQRTDVTSVDIVAKDGANLSGDFTCTFEGQAISVVGASEPSVSASISGAGTYYVAIAAGVNTPAVAIRMNKSGEVIPAVAVAPSAGLNFARATIKNVGRIDDRVVTDYYISPSGTGNGLSQSTPAGKSLLTSLAANDIYSNYVIAGTTFHMLEGTHTFTAALDLNPVVECLFTIKGEGTAKLVASGSVNFLKTQGSASVVLEDLTFNSFNGWQGGVLFMNGGKLTARNCNFGSNAGRGSSNGAGVIYATGASDASFSGCQFLSNKCEVNGNAPSVAMLYGNAFLKFDGCYFGSNSAVNRAVINSQGTSVVFINGCAFNNNSNTAASTYASVIHAGGAGVCVNNSTFYQNNGKADSKPLNNCECITASANMIITNSTFYEYFQANRGVIACTAAKKGVLFNNVILGNYSGTVLYFSSNNYTMTSLGHNIYRSITDYRTGDYKIGLPAATGDISGVAANVLGGGSWNSTSHVYSWNGSLTSGTLVKAASSEFEPAVKAMSETQSNTVLGSGKLGDKFWGWLSSINATGVDQLGTSRGDSWWPGAYQAN